MQSDQGRWSRDIIKCVSKKFLEYLCINVLMSFLMKDEN